MHFGLDRLLTGAKNGDQLIARQALVEGGATLVELLVDNARAGLMVPDSILQRVINDALNVMPSEGGPGFLFEQWHTPYVRGRAFVFALKRHGGWDAVNRAYINLPASSEHILHPDKYIAWELPEEIALPALARESFAGDWDELDRNTLGELGFRIIFNAFDLDVETAHAARPPGWQPPPLAISMRFSNVGRRTPSRSSCSRLGIRNRMRQSSRPRTETCSQSNGVGLRTSRLTSAAAMS